MNQFADAVVIGGGVIGTSIQYFLASKGVNSILMEKNSLGSGSTGRAQAILRMHYSNEVTTLLASKSLEVFKNFPDITGSSSGYTQTGYLLITDISEKASMQKNLEMMQSKGIKTEIISKNDLDEIAPSISISDNETMCFEPESGFADPHLVTNGFAKKSKLMGSKILLNTPVESINIKDHKVQSIKFKNGEIFTDTLIIAAGPWTKTLMAKLGIKLPLKTVRHQVILLKNTSDQLINHPIIGDTINGLSVRPESNNITMIGTGEDENSEPDSFNQGVDEHVVRKSFLNLSKRLGGISNSHFFGGWSGLFTITPDWHPILGKPTDIDGLYLAAGFSGHGFKLSPMIGLTMSDLIDGGTSTNIDKSELTLSRFSKGKTLKSRYKMKVLA